MPGHRILLLLACGAWLLAGEAPRIAVLPIAISEATPADAQAGMACEAALLSGLADAGAEPVERQRLDLVLRELALAGSGLVDASQAARVGGRLGAAVIVIASLRREGELRLRCRALASADGQVVWAGEADGSTEALMAQCARLAADLAAKAGAAIGADSATGDLEKTAFDERLAVLHRQGLHEEAAALAARRISRTDPVALGACLDALARSGFTGLAAAEARQRKLDWKKPAEATNVAIPADAAISDESLELRARRTVAAYLDAMPGDNEQLLDDRITAWAKVAEQARSENRQQSAMNAARQVWLRHFQLHARHPRILSDYDGRCLPVVALGPSAQLAVMLLTMRAWETIGITELPTGFTELCFRAAGSGEALPDLGPGWRQLDLPSSARPIPGNPTAGTMIYAVDTSALAATAVILSAHPVVGGERLGGLLSERINLNGTQVFAQGQGGPIGSYTQRFLPGLLELRRLGAKGLGLQLPLLTLSDEPIAMRVIYSGPAAAAARPSISALIEELARAIVDGDLAQGRKLAAEAQLAELMVGQEGRSLVARLAAAKP